MPRKYMLEVIVGDRSEAPLVYMCKSPFGSFQQGDTFNLLEGAGVRTVEIGSVEHTVWPEGKDLVHKVQLTTKAASKRSLNTPRLASG